MTIKEKIDQWDLIKTKNFSSSKDIIIKKVEKQTIDGRRHS